MTKAYFGRLSPGDYRIKQIYEDLFNSPPKLIAADIESPSLTNPQPIGLAIATPDGHSFYFDISDPELPWHLILPSDTWTIWHNASFDLSKEALGLVGADVDNIHDTVLITRMLPDIPNSLEGASQFVKTQTTNMGDHLKSADVKLVTDLPWEEVAEKCCRDAMATMEIFQRWKYISKTEYYETERKFTSLLIKMSYKGIKLDPFRVSEIDRELKGQLIYYEGICNSLGFNPHSPKQVASVLNSLGVFLPQKAWNNPKPDTSATVLSTIDKPIAKYILNAKKYRKLLSTYIGKWVDSDRVYTHFRTDGITGRTISQNQNVQNIPTGKREGDIVPKAGSIRSVFIPDPKERTNSELILLKNTNLNSESDYLSINFWGTKFDFEQLELRVLAYLSNDPEMLRILNSPDGDLHEETRIAMGLAPENRVSAKNVNFGMIFGGSNSVLVNFTGYKDINLVEQLRNKWIAKFPTAWNYIESQRRAALGTYQIETLYGRKINLLDGVQGYQSDKHIENCGINWPIQGTACEIFKRGLLIVADELGADNIVSQIHDEGWLNGVHKIPAELEHIAPFYTPIQTKYIQRFG